MQIQQNYMRYSIILRKFAKRATFGAVAKDNLLFFGMQEQKQKDYFFNDYKTFFLWVLAHFELQ
jgi:hypothetical protein